MFFNVLSSNQCSRKSIEYCIYYSYLLQAIRGRVTSEVNIGKMQMAAIFSLDSKDWRMNYAFWLYKSRL